MEYPVRKSVVVRKLNSLYWHYRSNRWRWRPGFRADNRAVAIDRPVFLLGTQGGGLTLTSRILRRSPGVVSVTGNHRYWAGEDEMQNVLRDVLPEKLTWRNVRVPGFDSEDHNWLYACDAFFGHYFEDQSGADEALRGEFRRILRGVLRLNRPPAANGPLRFVDKSQSYTVRVGLVHALLEDCHPRFVLLTRDPFAMCWRAVTRDRVVSALDKTDEEKLEVAVQHWKNSMQAALEQQDRAEMTVCRFEDLLRDPGRAVADICRFIEIPYDSSMLPGPDNHIPWGSAYDAFDRHKWYPLRADVNVSYLKRIPEWAVEVIQRDCRPLIERFGYEAPSGGR